MQKYVLILLSAFFFFSCTKEEVTPNSAPTSVSNFSITYGGTDDTYNWSDATDADGDAVTYDLYLLKDTNPKPISVVKGLTTSQYTTSVSYFGVTRAMIVVAKDGKGGETTSIEYPTIIL